MNPLYQEYCDAHEMTPEQMMAHDRLKYPGGRMCGFMLWCMRRKKANDEQAAEADTGGRGQPVRV
jgi:hypothetical protein